MQRRFIVYALFATLAIGGIAFAADALVVSDEEQVEHIADAMTEGRDIDRADVLQGWVDLSREPVLVTHGTDMMRYEDTEEFGLSEALGEAFAPLGQGELDVVQRSVQVDGDRATIALRVRSSNELTDTTIDLTRSGQGWLVTRVRTR